MSDFFQYQVDGDTARSCLGIVARAAERVARGESAFLGVKASHAAKRREGCRRKSWHWARYTPAVLAEVVQLRRGGMMRKEIAARTGLSLSQVDFIIYKARREVWRRPHVRTGGVA